MNVINRLCKEGTPLIQISKRYARKHKWKSWKNDWLPFNWIRPTPEQGYFDTGDRVERIEKFDKHLMPKAHEDAIREVGDVPDEIRNLLTYEFLRLRENTEAFRASQIAEKSNTHLGGESLKGLVVDYTYRIRKGRQMLREQPNHVGMKNTTNAWKGKRFKYLIQLRKFDEEAYRQMLKELEIDEPKMVIGGKIPNRIERKKELRRLTKEYCDNIYQKKMKAYHNQLIEQQKKFELEKVEFDEWMAKTMKEMKIDESQVEINQKN